MKKLALTATLLALGTTGAIAADMAVKAPAPAVVAPIYSWTGFYIGVNLGGAWTDSNPTTTTISTPQGYFNTDSAAAIGVTGNQRIRATSFTGGLTAGYNWHANNWLFGIESDFNYFGVKGATSAAGVYPCCAPSGFTISSSASSDWLITVRGRAGVLVAPAFLLYATGGLAVASVRASYLFTDNLLAPLVATESASISNTRYGWTAGVGGEYALMNGWSMKAEYLYVDLNRASTTSNNLNAAIGAVATNVFTHTIDLRSNIVRVGLNYKFGGGSVVAKY
jgi:outer membrane immunogenic protein